MRQLISILAAALTAALTPGIALADQHEKIEVAGQKRTFDVHVPKGASAGKVPLVIVLHGGLGCAFTAKIDSGMNRRADQRGFIVAYPEGTPEIGKFLRTWNAEGCCGTAGDKRVDDIAFVKAVIESVEEKYDIDKSRIYVSGMSNGGMLAYRVASEMSDTIAAAASVEGCLITPLVPPKSPVSILAFHGTHDRVLPYDGGTGALLWYKIHCLPVSTAISFWTRQDGCSLAPEQSVENGLLKQTFSGGKNGTEVCLYTSNGGHTWPDHRNWSAMFHPLNQRWATTDIICDFFAAHPKL